MLKAATHVYAVIYRHGMTMASGKEMPEK